MTVLVQPSLRWTLLLSALLHAALMAGVERFSAQTSGGAPPTFLQVVLKAPGSATRDFPALAAHPVSSTAMAHRASSSPHPSDDLPQPPSTDHGAPALLVHPSVVDAVTAVPASASMQAPSTTSPSVDSAPPASRPPERMATLRPVEVSGGAAGAQRALAEVIEQPRPLSDDELRSFRKNIANLAKRFKNYPALARERGWEGVVHVRVSLSPAMPRPEVALARSSDFPMLDQAALRMMVQAVQALEVPERYRGRQMGVVLPVDYRLDD